MGCRAHYGHTEKGIPMVRRLTRVFMLSILLAAIIPPSIESVVRQETNGQDDEDAQCHRADDQNARGNDAS
jgi:hypothetical protein